MDGRRVLLIEDDATTARLVFSLLRDEPYRLLWAPDGAEGLALARMHGVDAVLLPWVLPDMTGDDLARALRFDTATADAALILFSLEPWLFAPDTRMRAAQVVNKTDVQWELAPRVRDALGIPPRTGVSDTYLAQMRDRSLWWNGEQEADWRPAHRGNRAARR